jgi:hypothetical protein
LNVHEFESIEHVRERLGMWRIDCNDSRPHGARGHLTPSEYAQSGQTRGLEAPESWFETVCKREERHLADRYWP